MIKTEYLGKKLKITDIDGRVWHGKVAMLMPASQSDSGESELYIEFGGGLTEFKESEIKEIEEEK